MAPTGAFPHQYPLGVASPYTNPTVYPEQGPVAQPIPLGLANANAVAGTPGPSMVVRPAPLHAVSGGSGMAIRPMPARPLQRSSSVDSDADTTSDDSKDSPSRPVGGGRKRIVDDDDDEDSNLGIPDDSPSSSEGGESAFSAWDESSQQSSESEANSAVSSDSDFEFRPNRSAPKRKRMQKRGCSSVGARGNQSTSSLFVQRRRNPRAVGAFMDSGSDVSSDTSDWGARTKKRTVHKVSTYDLDAAAARTSTRRSAQSVKNYNENDMYEWGSDLGSDADANGQRPLAPNSQAIDESESDRAGSGNATKVVPLVGEPSATGEPNIEMLLDFRLRATKDALSNNPSDYEYFVKWQHWSHWYATWEQFSFLEQSKGAKKLSNYIKNVVEPEVQFRADPDVTAEEIDQANIQKELERDNQANYQQLERVIACRPARFTAPERQAMIPGSAPATGALAEALAAESSEPTLGTEMEYLCKWSHLSHKDCTWEPQALIVAKSGQAAIDAFYDRLESQTLPHRGEHYHSRTRPRPRFTSIPKQPSYLSGGELRDYQLTSINWMASLWSRNENGILADEMGLGKTVQTISFISYLFHSLHVYGPHLVVVPLSTITAWEREFERWAPDLNVISYTGDNRSRQAIRQFEFYVPPTGTQGQPIYPAQPCTTTANQELAETRRTQPKLLFNVVLTTYELVLKDRDLLGDIRWAFLAVDEAHRLKNRQSLLSEALRGFQVANCLLVTGTPLQNSVKELYALCNFLMPDKFSDQEHAVFDFQVADADPDKIRELHQRLRPYMLRRLKKEVEKSLPQKIERILRVELAPMQVHYYRNILTRNYQALNRGSTGASQMSLLNIVMELKKASNHPFLFPNAEMPAESTVDQLKGLVKNSGKMVLLDKLLTRLKAGGHRVLIFSQMVRLLDILSDYLALRGYAHQRLDGSVGSEARKKAIDQFNAPGSTDFVFLLSTRAGGLGINLTAADTVIIFDSDWNPQNDLQAMARAHRIGQTKTVNVYRFISKGTIEEDVIERAKRKMVLEYCIIKRMDTSGLSVLQDNAKAGPRVSLAAKAALQEMAGSEAAGQLAQWLPNNKGGSQQYFNKDELSAILKFGASNMFKESDTQKRLDDMDLDDILNRAEHHDTAATASAEGGLQGEEFLSQFQVADYGPGDDEMMEWDDIIPEQERHRAEEEAEQARLREEEELYWSSRRRRRVVYYAEDGSEIPNSKGGARGSTATSVGSGSRRGANGPSAGVGSQATGDPRQLSDKEFRAFYRAILRYGDVRQRFDDIVASAPHHELAGKDRSMLEGTFDRLLVACEKTLTTTPRKKVKRAAGSQAHVGSGDEANSHPRSDDNDDCDTRSKNAAVGGSGSSHSRACIIAFEGFSNINASVLVPRVQELRRLHDALSPLANPLRFRLSTTLKPVHNWACSWGQKDDAMLLVGVYRHGFGAWDQIRDDAELGFASKFSLGPSGNPAAGTKPAKASGNGTTRARARKTIDAPKATHLVRRCEYLLKVVEQQLHQARHKQRQVPSKPAATTASKSVRFNRRRRPTSSSESEFTDTPSRQATPKSTPAQRKRVKRAPSGAGDSDVDDYAHTPKPKSTTRNRASKASWSGPSKAVSDSPNQAGGGSSNQQPLGSPDSMDSGAVGGGGYSHYDSMDDDACKEKMRPVRHELKRIRKDQSTAASGKEKAQTIRECIKAIGDHIEAYLQHPNRQTTMSKVERDREHRHLWAFTSYFWPRPVSPTKLQSIYRKMVE
ncbi:ATP-dependent DNA helicase Hrp3 [Dimargaris verticillata]|uniref:ATP-dependent DNA helicase Hrp3 n=1 Tax=Dimargaris verticillata TaxID=2761393 RepID=A0A9W8B773_9FUNG|nr:ATP-dependent DNA helicase Hrp3 [Dimargaris verticillata]